MKKIFALLVIVLGFGFSKLSAQNLSLGVKAEANMSNFILSDLEPLESKMKVGAGIGGFLKIDFGEYFALQPELLVNMKNSIMEQNGIENKCMFWSIEIPLYAMGQMTLDNGERAYIGIGPYGSIGLSAKNRETDLNLYKEDGENGAFMQRGDVGVGVLVGYEFDFGMQINASYKYGLLNALDAGQDDANMYNQTVSLGIAYRF